MRESQHIPALNYSGAPYSQSIWIVEENHSSIYDLVQLFRPQYSIQLIPSFQVLQDALDTIEEHEKPDLIISELELTDGELLNLSRLQNGTPLMSKWGRIPFVVISSSDTEENLRKSFQEGAIDYLIKPFRPAEFRVKIERALKDSTIPRLQQAQQNLEEELRDFLTRKELEIVRLFFESGDLTATRDQLETQIWRKTAVHPKALDVHIHNLRKKIARFQVRIDLCGPGTWKISGRGLS